MKPRIIGLTGKKNSGKTTAAKYLRERHGYAGSVITEPMDEMLTPLLRRMGVPDDEILPRLNGPMKDATIPGFPWLTGRDLKQAIGREFRDAVSEPRGDGESSRTFFLILDDEANAGHPHHVNESVRYPFEGDHIRSKGGVVWRIVDPDYESDDDHESERDDVPADAEIVNRKDGVDALHRAIDALIGEEPSRELGLEIEDDPFGAFEADIDAVLNEHGPEIRAMADGLDASGDDDLSEVLDDVADEIKGALGTSAANRASDADAEAAISSAEKWVADNVSNSTSDRRIAAAYAFLGADGARKRLNTKG